MKKEYWITLADNRRKQITKLHEQIERLTVQLQDANRKLAALGHCPTRKLDTSITMAQRRKIRSLSQQDWDMLEEHEERIYKDWYETRKDAYNSGNP